MQLFVDYNNLYAFIRNKMNGNIQLGNFYISKTFISFIELINYTGISSFSTSTFSKNNDTIYGLFQQNLWIETNLKLLVFKKFTLPHNMIMLGLWNYK